MIEIITRQEALALKLWQREALFKGRGGKPVEPRYCIIWEDSSDLDSPANITTPAPMWLAMAIHGNILPPVSVYLSPDHSLHDRVVPAMTEEQAMEYLLQKDLPKHIWADTTRNRSGFVICKRAMIPVNREFRNAWRLSA